MEDSAIVELYWQRSDQAIAETERKYGAYCRRVAYTICENLQDAEECVSDAWLAAWNAMPDKRPQRLSTFLGCLTRHLAINRLRAGQAEKRGGGETALALDELGECISSGRDNPAREAEAKELGEAVRSFVSGLEEMERHVFLGRYWYLLPVAEIAARCGYSESKTKSLLHRLRKRLRAYLDKEGLL